MPHRVTLLITGLFALGLTACAGKDPDAINETFLTCADEATGPFRPEVDGEPARIREVSPSAGGAQNPALFEHARLQDSVYAIYEAFDEGGDYEALFPHDELVLNAFIMGTPGLKTERGPRANRKRTLYGYWATTLDGSRDYVLIRGTMQPREWVKNVQARQRQFDPAGEDVKVHRGFDDIYRTFSFDRGPFEGSFREALAAGVFAGREVQFVGHSLGGALASLAAAETAATVETATVDLITLAAPRVGNAAFGAYAGKIRRTDRVCNLVDLVPMVPPSAANAEYVHIGTPHLYSSFDYDDVLNNQVESNGSQVLCWHTHHVYAWMLDHDYDQGRDSACWE